MSTDRFIYGLHEPGGEAHLRAGSWIVFTHELGHDPTVQTGFDFSAWKDYNVIARLNNGYFPNGTIPKPEFYADFTQRCANFVFNSSGCHRWIIGNEPNHSQERPQGALISASDYIQCFNQVAAAIHAMYGFELDEVIPGAIAPWNVESGDWLTYFEKVLNGCQGVGAIALHTYTHGSDPSMIIDETKMDAPYSDRRYNFRSYQDFLSCVPERLRGLPVYITETDQTEPWADVPNSTWVQEAYKEIDTWNKGDGQKVHCLCLYRWTNYDQWVLEGKQNVIADFEAAQVHGYSVEGETTMNQFENPDFEGTYVVPVDHPEWDNCLIAPGWSMWFDSSGGKPKPEFKAALGTDLPLGHRVHGGEKAQQWFNSYAVHYGGVYQRVQVTAGAYVQAKAWFSVWSASGDDPAVSGGPQGNGKYRCKVSVDPTGGTDWASPAVLWGDEIYSYDVWTEAASPEVLCPGGYATFFFAGLCEYPVKNNNAYLDNATLNVRTDIPPTPTGKGFEDILDAVTAIETECAIIRDEIAAMQANVVLAYVVGTP